MHINRVAQDKKKDSCTSYVQSYTYLVLHTHTTYMDVTIQMQTQKGSNRTTYSIEEISLSWFEGHPYILWS